MVQLNSQHAYANVFKRSEFLLFERISFAIRQIRGQSSRKNHSPERGKCDVGGDAEKGFLICFIIAFSLRFISGTRTAEWMRVLWMPEPTLRCLRRLFLIL